jgi:hypothetical protein
MHEAREHADNEQQFRMMQLENDYDQFCQKEVRKRREADYPEPRLDAAMLEQMRIIRREQPNWYERASEAMRRDVALGRLNTVIRESLELPSFEDWSKLDVQRRLF